MKADSEQLQGFSCSVSSRVNSNGHTVYDVVEPGGLSRTMVLWEEHTAEVMISGQSHPASWQRDDDGDIQVSVNRSGVFVFVLPY